MKDLLIDVVKSIVDKPDEVSIELTESENTQIYELRVGEGDVGKVIGKQGKNVGAIRTLLSAATANGLWCCAAALSANFLPYETTFCAGIWRVFNDLKVLDPEPSSLKVTAAPPELVDTWKLLPDAPIT